MEPRRCGVHGLVVGADGRCVICRRGEPELAAPKTSGELPIVLGLVFAAVLATVSGAYWLTKKITARVNKPAVLAESQPAPPEPSEEPVEPVKKATPFPKTPGEVATASPVSTSAAEPPSPEQLEAYKRRVKVTMYMKKACQLCDYARGFLQSREYSLRELDVEASPTDMALLESANPQKTVPTFDVDGRVLVGYEVNALNAAIEKAARKRMKP